MKYIWGMQINIDVFYKFLPSFQVCIARLVCKISKVSKISFYIFAISPAKHGVKLRFGLQVKTKVFSKLIVSFWVCKVPKVTCLQYLSNISRKIQRMKLIFYVLINKSFFKLILSFQVWLTKHAHITQNNKFVISLQYLSKEVNGEVDFCIERSMKVSCKSILWF